MRQVTRVWKKLCTGLVVGAVAISIASSTQLSNYALSPAIAEGEQHCWRPGNLRLLTINAKSGGHSLPVRSVAFSPDGKFLASGSADKTIKIWDLSKIWNKQGQTPKLLSPTPEQIYSVAFSPDGQILASGSLDGAIRLWDWKTGRNLNTYSDYPRTNEDPRITVSVTFSPDGQFLAATGFNRRSIVFRNVATGISSELVENYGVSTIAFSSDGETLAVSTLDGFVKLWNWKTKELIRPIGKYPSAATSLSFSPDGQLLAFVPQQRVGSSEYNQICFWNTQGEQVGKCLQGHTDEVSSFVFSPNGKYLISGSWDDSVKVWDVASRSLIYDSPENSRRVLSVAFSPDGQAFARGSGDSTFKILRCRQ